MAVKPMPKPMPAMADPAMVDPAMADPAMADPAMDYAADEAAPEGYVIEIMVMADGTFTVSKEEMMAEAEEAPGEEAMSYDSLGQALKAVMALVKDNPMAASEQSQFDAGFGANAA